MPRILQATRFVMNTVAELDYKFGSLPFCGGLHDQPIWFTEMFNHHQLIKGRVMKEINNTKVGK